MKVKRIHTTKIAKLLGLNSETIPYSWNSTIKVRYEWKEHLGNFDSYRGIALECTTFKVPTKLFTNNESADDCPFRLCTGLMDAESM
jgi:predicted nucleic acid binding AN1-type Zn finger protein